MHTQFTTIYRTHINAPIEKVWEALISPSLVKQYFFGTDLVTDWAVGSPIYFRGEWEHKTYEDKGTVLEFVPYSRLSYSYLSSWSGLPDTPDNYLLVSYEVASVAEGTALTITQSNYDAEKAEHSKDNWTQVIEGMKKIL